ncbi:MAG: prenyltransferase [Bacteroidetes bacterium ADurb.Bin408]|nr:MAG: prenyltransferase [Bacteroidetes bacterium ADurb.Bin408]
MRWLNNFLRVSNWWHYKAAPLMAFIYAKAYINKAQPETLIVPAIVFFLAVIGIASLGHFINDWADIEEDRRSGKQNYVAGLSHKQRIISGILLTLFCLAPWLYLKTDVQIIALLCLQLLLYIVYSVRPFRLKNRHISGIVADTLYGHVIPALVVLAVFSYYGSFMQLFSFNNLFAFILITWLFCKGMRNIILHQLDDRKKDRMAGINTFVTRFGNVFSLNFINRLILPLELFVFMLLVYFACDTFRNFYIPFFAFLFYTFMKFSLWKIFVLPPRQMRFKFLFFLNDFYEDWLPVVILGYLIQYDIYFVFYLVAHLALFPKTILNLWKDLSRVYSRKAVKN